MKCKKPLMLFEKKTQWEILSYSAELPPARTFYSPDDYTGIIPNTDECRILSREKIFIYNF